MIPKPRAAWRSAQTVAGTLALAFCWASVTFAGPGRGASVVVNHSERTLGKQAEPLAPVSVAYLSGDELHVPDNLRAGTAEPSWMPTWRRQLTNAWQVSAHVRHSAHPLGHLAPSILALDDRPGTLPSARPWDSLDCAQDELREVDAAVLARTTDGSYLVGVDLRCRSKERGRTDSRWRRLVVHTNALGQAQAVAGLESTQRAAHWPVRPATIRNQPVQGQAVPSGTIVSLDLDPTPPASLGLLDHGPLPQPERWRPTAEIKEIPRVIMAFDRHGSPAQMLAAGAMAATSNEATAALNRHALERALAPPQNLAPRALDDAVIEAIWLGAEAGLALVLELGTRSSTSTVHNAAVAGWRWTDGLWRRVDIGLPRTSAEGRWSCGADAAAGSLLCSFEQPPLPTARGFRPMRVEVLRPKAQAASPPPAR